MIFFIPLKKIPTVTSQEKGVTVTNGKPHVYKTAKIKQAEELFCAHLAKYAPEKPLQGAIRLRVHWCFPADGKHEDGDWKITKPDTDNLQKIFKDCMTRVGFWNDDSQVAFEVILKYYDINSGIAVFVEEV